MLSGLSVKVTSQSEPEDKQKPGIAVIGMLLVEVSCRESILFFESRIA